MVVPHYDHAKGQWMSDSMEPLDPQPPAPGEKRIEIKVRDVAVPYRRPDGSYVPCAINTVPDLNFYQGMANATAQYAVNGPEEVRAFARLVYPAGKLAGEAGEVLQKTLKLYRDKGVWRPEDVETKDVLALMKELGGCFWYIAACCTELGVSLHDVALINLNQLQDRSARGTLLGDGDDR